MKKSLGIVIPLWAAAAALPAWAASAQSAATPEEALDSMERSSK